MYWYFWKCDDFNFASLLKLKITHDEFNQESLAICWANNQLHINLPIIYFIYKYLTQLNLHYPQTIQFYHKQPYLLIFPKCDYQNMVVKLFLDLCIRLF